jgi:peptidoglycan lytic transglycosylase G
MLDDLDLAWEEQREPRRRGGPPSRQQRRRKRNDRKRRGRSFGALFVSMILLAVLGGGVYWGVGQLQENQSFKEFTAADYEASESGDEVMFTVEEDEGGFDMGAALLAKGVVKSVKAFTTAFENETRSRNIQPGTYKLKLKMPAADVIKVLINKDNKLQNVFTIREGLSVIETLKRIAEATKLPLADFQNAAKDPAALGITPDWYTRTDGKPAATSVEGFLFPDTYSFEPNMTAADILKMMVKQFLKVTADINFKANAQKLGVSPYEALIVASLAQVEAGKNEDLPKVARVAYNRGVKKLIDCECLQFDVTANYWLELQGKPQLASKDMTEAELDDKNNPYNTGPSSTGLPIGPISNPGKLALDGAAQPPAADWIYFVATDKNGTTKFASTSAEHDRNVQEACRNGVLTC